MILVIVEFSEIEENDLLDVVFLVVFLLYIVEIEVIFFLEFKFEQKNFCREIVFDGNYFKDFSIISKFLDKMKIVVIIVVISLYVMMLISFFSVNKLDDDVVIDGGDEDNKRNLRVGFNKLDEEIIMNLSK